VQVDRLGEGRKVLLFGNGGSATDASHIAAEFVGRYHKDRAPLPAIALSADMAAITCIGNDYGYDEIFARQVKAHGQKGDVAIAISTSGNSPNVLKGVEAAKACGLTTIGWTGHKGGKLAGVRPDDLAANAPPAAGHHGDLAGQRIARQPNSFNGQRLCLIHCFPSER